MDTLIPLSTMKTPGILLLALLLLPLSAPARGGDGLREQARFHSPAARQGACADGRYFYAIDNRRIMQYTLQGDSAGQWQARGEEQEAIFHLNSATPVGHLLYCAHSNYPRLPMTSSVEIFDTRTMAHAGSISLGIRHGSLTWLTPQGDKWYAFFAHYENKAQEPGKDVSWSQLVEFDRDWRELRSWTLPQALVEKVRPHSLSGGVLADSLFYCTGHDAAECYVLRLPRLGSSLEWVDTLPLPFHGQAFGIDPEGNFWGIERKTQEVIRATRP